MGGSYAGATDAGREAGATAGRDAGATSAGREAGATAGRDAGATVGPASSFSVIHPLSLSHPYTPSPSHHPALPKSVREWLEAQAECR